MRILCIFVYFVYCVWALRSSRIGVSSSEGIPIGLIADRYEEKLRTTFDYAISVANSYLSVPLVGFTKAIYPGNTIQAFNSLCELMENGIGGIFGPSSKHSNSHLMSVCDSKDLPYIYFYMAEDPEGLNLHPHPLDVANALHSLIDEFEWSRFIFLYESSEYLSILNGLMSYYGSDGPVIVVMRYDLKLNGNYKAVLRRVRKSVDSRIVVVGSTQSVSELLKQAQQVGIMNEDYKYIIGNLDLHTFDLEEYKYSETNITGFRLFSPNQPEVQDLMTELSIYQYQTETETETANTNDGSCPITLEMALTFDAVQVFAKTLEHLPHYRPQSLDCSIENDNVQVDGSTFKNYMRSVDTSEKTLTGRIYFDGNVRKGYNLDIIELQSTGLVKVGTWNEEKGIEMDRPPLIVQHIDLSENSLVNKTFRVLISVPNKPYASLVESFEKLEGNNQYEGYVVDLITELADKLGFNFTLINGGNDYGSFNKTTNVTTGMLKEILEGRADLAMTDLTITSERQEAIEFSIPFMNLGIAILFKVPEVPSAEFFSFMDPFSGQVWLYLGIAYVGVSLSFFILGRLSPTEWDNPYPCIEEPDELENQFTVSNSLWFTTGAVLQQGSEIAPKALSTRTLAAIWWFFTLIIVSSYTANLAAFLTIENPVNLIKSVEDLADNVGGVQYGAKKSGSTRNFFLTSEDEMYKKMNEYMINNPQNLMETNQDGMNRVTAEKRYAFLMESTSIDYNTVRGCELMKIGEPLDEKGYGIAMMKNWPYRDKFNNALLELQEQGVLAKMKNKWWNEVGAGVCDKKGSDASFKPLEFDNLGGVYVVLVVGCIFSFIFGIALWCRMVIRKSRYYDVPFKDAFIEEFKIVIDFKNSERVLKSSASVYSRSRNSLTSIDSLATDSEEEEEQETEREEGHSIETS